MDKITIEKGSTAESMMLPLYARAFCDRYFPRTFRDPEAAALMGRLDYDFSAIENAYGPAQMSAFAVKVRILSELVRGYLRLHPGALVANLGCGADLTFGLVDNGSCRGLNIDLPRCSIRAGWTGRTPDRESVSSAAVCSSSAPVTESRN